MQENLDKIRFIVALRMARAAVGWSQEELAQRLGIAKTTIARIETAEGSISTDQLPQILRLYKSQGVSIDYMLGEDVTVKVDKHALRQAQVRLSDSELRRSDRKRPLGIIESMQQQPDVGESKGLINSFLQKSGADD